MGLGTFIIFFFNEGKLRSCNFTLEEDSHNLKNYYNIV